MLAVKADIARYPMYISFLRLICVPLVAHISAEQVDKACGRLGYGRANIVHGTTLIWILYIYTVYQELVISRWLFNGDIGEYGIAERYLVVFIGSFLPPRTKCLDEIDGKIVCLDPPYLLAQKGEKP
jgi:hypothetical protein